MNVTLVLVKAVIVTVSYSYVYLQEGAIPSVFPTAQPLVEMTLIVVAPTLAIAVSFVDTTVGTLP